MRILICAKLLGFMHFLGNLSLCSFYVFRIVNASNLRTCLIEGYSTSGACFVI